MSRPHTKKGGRKLELYLSEKTRDYLQSEAEKRGVSRSQIVEDLVLRPGNVSSPQNNAGAAAIASALDSTPLLKVAEDPAPAYGKQSQRRLPRSPSAPRSKQRSRR
jgi:hypothetical protein